MILVTYSVYYELYTPIIHGTGRVHLSPASVATSILILSRRLNHFYEGHTSENLIMDQIVIRITSTNIREVCAEVCSSPPQIDSRSLSSVILFIEYHDDTMLLVLLKSTFSTYYGMSSVFWRIEFQTLQVCMFF